MTTGAGGGERCRVGGAKGFLLLVCCLVFCLVRAALQGNPSDNSCNKSSFCNYQYLPGDSSDQTGVKSWLPIGSCRMRLPVAL